MRNQSAFLTSSISTMLNTTIKLDREMVEALMQALSCTNDQTWEYTSEQRAARDRAFNRLDRALDRVG